MSADPLVYPNPAALPLRFLMNKKEAECIIGEKEAIIQEIRKLSGAKIDISDGAGIERIVTITGTILTIYYAVTYICRVFHENIMMMPRMRSHLSMTLQLILPTDKCGFIIGKRGINVKFINQSTNAFVWVSKKLLPNSSERCVSVTGTSECVANAIYLLCQYLLKIPDEEVTMPYNPNPELRTPIIFADGQAYKILGKFAIPLEKNVTDYIISTQKDW